MIRLVERLLEQSRSTSARLVLLVLCAVLPTLASIGIDATLARRDTLKVAEQRVLELARTAAEQQNDMVQEATNLLRVLARIRSVNAATPGACHSLLMNVADDHPRITNITVTDASGRARCDSRDEEPDYNLADRRYFQELMGPDRLDFTLSELLIGKRIGKPTIIAAVPLMDRGVDGRPKGVLVASLNMQWAANSAQHLPSTDSQSVVIFDARDGTVLASSSDPKAVGHKFPDHALMRAFHDHPGGGVMDTFDFKGVRNVFGFTVLPGTQGHMVVAAGLTEDAVYGDANRHFIFTVALALSVTFLAMLLCLFGARAWLLQPGAAIIATVQAFGMGDMRKRIAPEGIVVTELKHIALTFNAMADAIEEEDRELAAAYAAIAISEAMHRTLAENVTDMITSMDADFVRIYASPSCRTLLGYSPSEMLNLKPGGFFHPDDVPMMTAALWNPLREGALNARSSFRGIRKDGSQIWLETSGQPMRDSPGYVFITRDISERKRFETSLEAANQQLEKFAREDALTGLANRRRFDEAFDIEWRRAAREFQPLGLLLVDLDRFKAYNDRFGHPAGDACLHAVATAVRSVLRRPADLAARYGGEEIAVILPATDSAGAFRIAERLTLAVRNLCIPHPGNAGDIVTISVGVASSLPSLNTINAQDLLERADLALYEAKHEGRDRAILAADTFGFIAPEAKAPVLVPHL